MLARMMLDDQACYRAARARDRRFDGRFYIAVATTGIYCRPVCPARAPKRENMRFFPSAASAEQAGYRPCLRCRPERAPGYASVDRRGHVLRAAIAGIEEHALSEAGLADLASAVGVSERQLRRVFEAELGVSPIALAQTQRLLMAKRLMRDTDLSLTQIAFASGFKSLRRFNALFLERYGASPRTLRQRTSTSGVLTCELDFRPPLAWEVLLDYLRRRAIPGIEHVDATHYRRTVALGGCEGWLAVSRGASGHSLTLELDLGLAPVVGTMVARIKRLFDLGAVPSAVSACLERDPLIAVHVQRLPGLRVVGAFEGFELGVRAVLGQQISVKAATTVAGRFAARFGSPATTPFAELNRHAPTPARIATAGVDEIAALGIVSQRAKTLIALAQAVDAKRIVLAPYAPPESQIAALMALPGIGPWTAQYIAMRALHWPDAFPAGDLMLQRAAGLTEAELLERAERWRPWRAYAAHYLWHSHGNPT
jgi:AraC family transcriptional regulator of adaptative response / DNA-3-methyladenine glycosylase II